MLSLCKSKSLFVFLNLAWAESMIFLLCRTQLDKSQQMLALLFYKTVIFVAPCYCILIILKLCRVLVCLLAELILLFFQSFHIILRFKAVSQGGGLVLVEKMGREKQQGEKRKQNNKRRKKVSACKQIYWRKQIRKEKLKEK